MTMAENYNNNKIIKSKNVLVGVRIDGQSREVLSWALVKVADPGDCVVAIHVCRNSDQAQREKHMLDDYLDVYNGLCSVKKVKLNGQIITGNSVRKVLVKEAMNYTDVTLVLGISKKTTLGTSRGSISLAKYCAKKLSSTTDVLAIHNGKILFRSCTSNNQPPGGDPKPSLYYNKNNNSRETQSEFGGDSECDTETVISVTDTIPTRKRNISRSCSVLSVDSYFHSQHQNNHSLSSFMEQSPGWPLLRRAPQKHAPLAARNLSVVQWVMSLPDRSPIQSSTISEDSGLENETETIDVVSDCGPKLISLSSFSEIPQQGLRNLIQETSFGANCECFTLDFLKASTSDFSSERLVGKGGCNQVYKGIFPDGKKVAVKILDMLKQGWKNFALEFDIISSLKHENVAHLLGVCVENDALISVYDFLPKGNLEDNLHGKSKDRVVLSWEVRYGIAIGISKAIYYLHKECPQPVIHRDIKSSNILLSDEFEPKLSDFGLAKWGPKGSNFITEGDVVGTFGYLAPEYFMYGRVSDKIDVYAFGVVLLELLSGRRPIGAHDISINSKGQESLVMWAKPRIEKGDVKGLLDPSLDGKVDEVQMHRMALAASLCITRSARLRPSIDQIMKLLKGDKDVEKWVISEGDSQPKSENKNDNNNEDDEVYPDSSAELHLGVALLDVDDDATSFSSSTNNLSLEEYFKGRCSRSSSFD